MATLPMTRAIRNLRQLVEPHNAEEPTDRQLLERFVGHGDDAAFAQVVWRHGAMVFGVCRRVLSNHHDAEDAYQATFLVLARRAASVRWHDSAGGWLFRVAYHLALKMKAGDKRRNALPLADLAVPGPDADREDLERRSAILDEELSRLPVKYRAPLLLCYYEGRSRAQAARQLGWKEGAVKIRLERGRALLRARLMRRGLGVVAGTLIAENVASAAVPASLAERTLADATLFAAGKLPATVVAARLAEGVLRTMLLTRWTIMALAALMVLGGCIGLGLGAHRAFADPERDTKPRQVLAQQSASQPQDEKASEKPAVKQAEKPLRVLLFAGAASREYQFVRAHFVRQMEKQHAEVTICLQTGGQGIVQDVPPERLLKRFPTRMTTDETDDAEDRSSNLERYDVVIAFDPDWSQLTEKQGQFLEKWVSKEGRGLIVIAGPTNTPQLGRPGELAQKLKPILDLLPVRVQDDRAVEKQRDTSRPWSLSFPAAEGFLQLDGEKKEPLAGWSEFFYGKKRDDWQETEDEPVRGFFTAYPIRSLKPGAVVHAAFRDPAARIDEGGGKRRDLPYLVTMSNGKGRTIYVGSSETWRLRQFREECHERFWTQLARHAAGRPVRKP